MNKIQHFRDLRYGLFIHFGLYSMLGGYYEGKETPFLAEWIRHSLHVPDGVYRKLAESFDPVNFDADAICLFARENGMRYLCFTAKHHDGFALFDSKADAFNSVKKSPQKRDFVRELAISAKKHGLDFCLYYSQAQDWDHPGGKRAYDTQPDTSLFEAYLTHKCLPQIEELLTQYGPITMLWLDTPIDMTKKESQRITELVRRLQPDCLISGRVGHGLGDYMTTGDNRMPQGAQDRLWEMPASLYTSWGYKDNDRPLVSHRELLRLLTKAVGRGGNLLVNVGPDGAGNIPDEALFILQEAGHFLRVYHEAFDAPLTVPDYPYEQDDFLFSASPSKLFIHLLRWPDDQLIELYHVESQVTEAMELQSKTKLELLTGRDLEGHAYMKIRLDRCESEIQYAIDRFGQAVLALTLTEPSVSISNLS